MDWKRKIIPNPRPPGMQSPGYVDVPRERGLGNYSTMKKIIGLVILFGVGLLGCVPQAEEGAGVSELAGTVPVTRVVVGEEATDVPVVRPSPTLEVEFFDGDGDGEHPRTFPSKSLDDVSCGNLKEAVEARSYWLDEFIPGESTIDEFVEFIKELPPDKRPIQDGETTFIYNDGESIFSIIHFQDGMLFAKSDPRQRLGEIISYYGEPVLVTWELPHNLGIFSIDRTILYLPQSNAIFMAQGQITYFNADAVFRGDILAAAYYEEIFAEYSRQISDDERIVQHFPWPCRGE